MEKHYDCKPLDNHQKKQIGSDSLEEKMLSKGQKER
jgi:hypothetical protein